MNEVKEFPNRVVIAGGSGFLGLNLARALGEKGVDVIVLSRTPPVEQGKWTHVTWNGRSLGEWAEALDGADALVNLAGRSVDCIKTPEHRDQILRSRVESTTVLGNALRSVEHPPSVWVQMSTAHIYGDPPEDILIEEDSAFGEGLAPQVGIAWEKALREAALPNMRTVLTRTSFVLGRNKGALAKMGKMAKIGLGGTLGHGRQGMSWIHEEDMTRIFLRALADETMQGAYIVTVPNPVSNKEFMRELRKAVGQPIGLPATSWMIRIGAPLVLNTDPELALLGRYCIPKRLQAEGFEFTFPTLQGALSDLYTRELS